MNEAVQFYYYPIGHYIASDGFDEHCPTKKTSNDLNCEVEKHSSCLLSVVCGGVHCANPADQLALARNIYCLEAQHASDMDFARACMSTAGFNATIIEAVDDCYGNDTAKEAAWDMVTQAAAPAMAAPGAVPVNDELKCTPWVVVDHTAESHNYTGSCFGADPYMEPLMPLLCDKLHPQPAGCTSKRSELRATRLDAPPSVHSISSAEHQSEIATSSECSRQSRNPRQLQPQTLTYVI